MVIQYQGFSSPLNLDISSLLLLPPVLQRLSEHEVQRSMQLFGAVISSLERSQAGLLEVTEHQAVLMIGELEQEITELRRRSTALAKLAQTENYITGLKVCNVVMCQDNMHMP